VHDVLASCPSVMIWDDHDIYDGYGSHTDDNGPFAQAFFVAARHAFAEFQSATNPPALPRDGTSFACAFTHNGVGVLVLDTRTHRLESAGRVLGDTQIQATGHWLRSEPARGLHHLFVVSSIPFVHLKITALQSLLEGTGGAWELTDDVRDAWTSSRNQNECRRILMRLFQYADDHPETLVTVLSGDVHVASLAQLESRMSAYLTDGRPARLYQVVSSGIGSPPPGAAEAFLMRQITGSTIELGAPELTGQLLRLSGVRNDPYLLFRRNFAILNLETRGGGAWDEHKNVWVNFFAEDGDRVEHIEHCLLRP
jgi:phosphodiesterase/alkaline phosphatase D-like protein